MQTPVFVLLIVVFLLVSAEIINWPPYSSAYEMIDRVKRRLLAVLSLVLAVAK